MMILVLILDRYPDYHGVGSNTEGLLNWLCVEMKFDEILAIICLLGAAVALAFGCQRAWRALTQLMGEPYQCKSYSELTQQCEFM